jgi:hypothetical protein
MSRALAIRPSCRIESRGRARPNGGSESGSGDPPLNLCIFAEAQIDRSPTGSGATARMALDLACIGEASGAEFKSTLRVRAWLVASQNFKADAESSSCMNAIANLAHKDCGLILHRNERFDVYGIR